MFQPTDVQMDTVMPCDAPCFACIPLVHLNTASYRRIRGDRRNIEVNIKSV